MRRRPLVPVMERVTPGLMRSVLKRGGVFVSLAIALVRPVWQKRNELIVVFTSTKLFVKEMPLGKTFDCASRSVKTTSFPMPGTPPSQLEAVDHALLTPNGPFAPLHKCAACKTNST